MPPSPPNMMHRFLYALLVPLLFASFAGAAEVPSFRNQIIPLLTKTGCNSGACHGALAGKGGLKLSLRGFDPESDHFVLTRQALARRVDLTNAPDSFAAKSVDGFTGSRAGAENGTGSPESGTCPRRCRGTLRGAAVARAPPRARSHQGPRPRAEGAPTDRRAARNALTPGRGPG